MASQHLGKHYSMSSSRVGNVRGVTQIEFLGIQIDKNGIKMQTHIVQKKINSNEALDTKKKLQSFLGLVNQVREYIPK